MMIDYNIQELCWGESLELPSSRSLRNTAHIIGGRYPCRSIALIPRLILSDLLGKKNVKVLDPFMGSGTTAVEASALGFTPYGLEVDPFARLISEVSVSSYSEQELENITTTLETIKQKFSTHIPDQRLRPETKNIEYWFDKDNFDDLLKLKSLIMSQCEKESEQRFFLAVFSDIIRATSKAERQSLKPYISKKYKKVTKPVLPTFEKAFLNYFSAIKTSKTRRQSEIRWLSGDATDFQSRAKLDVAITSPPYINAMDYVRCIKLESAWIGTGNDKVFSEVRQDQLGEYARVIASEQHESVDKLVTPHLDYLATVDKKRFRTTLSYFNDMHSNISSVYKALKKGAYYHIIVGNSVIRSREVETHRILADLGELVGFKWDGYFTYPIKDHRTSLPRNGRGGKIATEHVISLKKA